MLERPVPRAVLLGSAVVVAGLFAIAFAAFRYPLSYCDSPGWAPNYLGDLIGREPPPAASPRGWPVTAFLGALGRVATGFHWSNFIGFVQGLLLLATVLFAGRRTARSASVAALVLLPAFLFSAMRHAVYSQTLLSEPLALALAVALTLVLISDGIPTGAAVAAGAGAAVLAAIRVDLAYFAPMLLLRPFSWALPGPRRRALSLAVLGGAVAATVLVSGVGKLVGTQDYPTGRILMIAEWSQLTARPTHGLAAPLETPLARRLADEMAARNFRTFEEAMPLARELVTTDLPTGWVAIGRLVLYDAVNRPGVVIAHRLAALHDLFASVYASWWPEYRSRSGYYSTYAAVFSGWSLRELNEGLYSPCAYLSVAQRQYYQATGIAHEGAARLLLALHRAATPYARFVLRPLVWLALAAFVVLLVGRQVSTSLAWAAAILATHFVLRALLVCADERYELPVDLLLIGFTAVVVPRAFFLLRKGAPAA